MAKTAVITTRIEPELKKDVNAIFKKLGLSATEAVTLFYKMVKKKNGLPFESEVPNKETQSKPAEDDSWLGCLEDCTEIHGDIVSPVMDENQWEALAE
ncbi:MAG: type II toxin-antitoxin system RelB/DinJ family antitoxin [Candidatus Aminicenantes bacterium]|nr:type II toxin-antitoxin system RelB/DinJ family antitoxin [Candidatus Aminicenantes bacterium]NIM82981.1 type II toxin-antitoxin system RelB/DinJ family antitoxin [Candidatus Aminicenantes bacterium]NIN22366.1 type II toxin-antitoxin system RelB/DinJ family antitoxin [Candidatus Aminicenantes bacterium]NIN46126.1 type II toxin-antitoxin system RelB/DinJ family antitoxin [Candidatus Aminicenantes bacterium]NIN88962.1 type II toxin-antitoxin system RelB/DinJ family antitoxin [Candidatus Aminic